MYPVTGALRKWRVLYRFTEPYHMREWVQRTNVVAASVEEAAALARFNTSVTITGYPQPNLNGTFHPQIVGVKPFIRWHP